MKYYDDRGNIIICEQCDSDNLEIIDNKMVGFGLYNIYNNFLGGLPHIMEENHYMCLSCGMVWSVD